MVTYILLVLLALILLFSWFVLSRLRISSDLDVLIANELKRTAGSADQQSLVLAIDHDGEPHYYAHGPISEHPVPAEEAIFQIGSVTKIFVAALLQILHDRGELDMDAKLSEVLDDSHPLDERVRNITLRQLACHRSGFPRVPKTLIDQITQSTGKAQVMLDPYIHLRRRDVLSYLANPEDFLDDGKFHYSNYGMGLLGHILEHVTSHTLEDLIQLEICAPLDMEATGFNPARLGDRFHLQGHNGKGAPTPNWHFSALAGAGGLYSCAEDLMKFLQACLRSETPLEKSLQAMQTPHPEGKTAIGWMLATTADRFLGQRDLLWHDGRVGGFSAYVAIDPSEGIAQVLLRDQSIDTYWPGTLMMWKLRKFLTAHA